MVKIIIVIVFLLIIASLGSALFHLVKNQGQSKKIAKSLTIRIGLSLLLFIFLMFAVSSGIIKPHGIGANMQRIKQMQKAP